MANITKYNKELIDNIMKDLAQGISIKTSLKKQNLINEAIQDSKHKDKVDLGSTHLVKEFISLAKWRAEKLNAKVYGKKDNLTLSGDKSSPLVVKWNN